jgi:hypothetical protein
MWRWIVKEWKRDKTQDVDDLKIEWLSQHYPDTNFEGDCFFCEYDENMYYTGICSSCPGRLVSRYFLCTNPAYHYENKPDKFLAKIEQLNKKRLKK